MAEGARFKFEAYDGGAFNYAERVAVECSQSGFSNIWINPQNGTTNQAGPFIFDIDPSVDKYCMLSKAQLEMDLRMVDKNGEDLKFDDIAAPVDLIAVTFWESVEVFLNGQPFAGASAVNASYKAFLETMLSYDSDSANSHLQSQFFYQDSPGEYDSMVVRKHDVRNFFYQQIEDERIEGPVIESRWKKGAKVDNATLMAEENARRDAKGENPVPAGWVAPDYSEADKLKERIKVYEPFFEGKLTNATKIMLADDSDKINIGFNARAKVVRGSEVFDVVGPICHDFFRVDNNLGPGNRLQLKLTRHKDPFLINTYLEDKGMKILIDEMRLHLHYIHRRERIRPPLHEVYRMNETQMHKQLVNAMSPSITFRVHNGGVLPKQLIMAMVSVNQAEGSYRANPFHLHHYFMKNVSLNINGEQYPMTGIETDFERLNPKIARAFRFLFDNTGAADTEKGNLVSWASYMSGCTVTVFNIDFDLCNMRHLHQAWYGFMDATIKFSRPLPEPIYVLYEKVFPKVVINDKLSNTLTVLDIEA